GQRLIGGDARAQQRGGDVEVERVGDPADEAFVDDDLLGVAALGDRAVDVGGVVGADISSQAVLLLTGRALLAFAAGVDQAAHAHPVADLPVGDRVTDGLDDPGDLVADGEREVRLTPFVADGVDVAVADAGCSDVDDHVIGARGPTFDHAHTERLIGAGLLQCLDGDAHRISLCSNVRGWATSSSTCSRTVYSMLGAPFPGPAQSLLVLSPMLRERGKSPGACPNRSRPADEDGAPTACAARSACWAGAWTMTSSWRKKTRCARRENTGPEAAAGRADSPSAGLPSVGRPSVGIAGSRASLCRRSASQARAHSAAVPWTTELRVNRPWSPVARLARGPSASDQSKRSAALCRRCQSAPGAGEVRLNQVGTTPPRRTTSAAVSTRCIAAGKFVRRRGTRVSSSTVVGPYRA